MRVIRQSIRKSKGKYEEIDEEACPPDLKLATSMASKRSLRTHDGKPYSLFCGIDQIDDFPLSYLLYMKTIKLHVWIIGIISLVYALPTFIIAFLGVSSAAESYPDLTKWERFYYFLVFTNTYVSSSPVEYLQQYVNMICAIILSLLLVGSLYIIEINIYKGYCRFVDPALFTVQITNIGVHQYAHLESTIREICNGELQYVSHVFQLREYYKLKRKASLLQVALKKARALGDIKANAGEDFGIQRRQAIERDNAAYALLAEINSNHSKYYASKTFFTVNSIECLDHLLEELKKSLFIRETFGPLKVKMAKHHEDINWERVAYSDKMLTFGNVFSFLLTSVLIPLLNFTIVYFSNLQTIRRKFIEEDKVISIWIIFLSLLVIQLIMLQFGFIYLNIYFLWGTKHSSKSTTTRLQFIFYNSFYVFTNIFASYYGMKMAYELNRHQILEENLLAANAYLGLQMIKNTFVFIIHPFPQKFSVINIIKIYKRIRLKIKSKDLTTHEAFKILEGPNHNYGTASSFPVQCIGFTTFYMAFTVPIIQIFLFLGLIVFFWVEKVTLLRVYKRPDFISVSNIIIIYKVNLFMAAISFFFSYDNYEVLYSIFSGEPKEVLQVLRIFTNIASGVFLLLTLLAMKWFSYSNVKRRAIKHLIKKGGVTRNFDSYHFSLDHYQSNPANYLLNVYTDLKNQLDTDEL